MGLALEDGAQVQAAIQSAGSADRARAVFTVARYVNVTGVGYEWGGKMELTALGKRRAGRMGSVGRFLKQFGLSNSCPAIGRRDGGALSLIAQSGGLLIRRSWFKSMSALQRC